MARGQGDAAVLARHRRRGQGQIIARAHHDVAACAQLRALHVFVVVRGDQRVALLPARITMSPPAPSCVPCTCSSSFEVTSEWRLLTLLRDCVVLSTTA